jgi:hypothetical protein
MSASFDLFRKEIRHFLADFLAEESKSEQTHLLQSASGREVKCKHFRQFHHKGAGGKESDFIRFSL